MFTAVLLWLAPVPAFAFADPPAKPDQARAEYDPPVNIYIEKPADLQDFLKKLSDPDFILLRGDELRKRIEHAPANSVPDGLPPAVVESVEVRGDVVDALANLAITFGVALDAEGPAWVTLRLDDQVLVAVSADDRALPHRYVAGKGWQVELRGKGRHQVRAELKVRLKTTGEGARLDCAIPESGRTDLKLDVPYRIIEAQAGPGEAVEHQALAGGARTRLSAALTPRARLVLTWRAEAEPGAQLPPLLSIQGEIAVDVEPLSFRTRCSWMIHALRGTAKTLEFRLDPEDDVLELELDGQVPPASIDKGGTRMTINLIEPLEPAAPKRLVMTTRRAIAAGPAARVLFHGFSLLNARDQSGAVGVVKAGGLWVEPTSGRGLQRIDPRELPTELRARPATTLAYQFVDQPFELGLRVEPSPPLIRVEGRTTVALSATQARVRTRLDYQAARGRVFDVKVALPPGLELESVGPEEIVESSRLAVEPSGREDTRILTVQLKLKARESGAFALQLAGRQAIDPAGPVAVALFQPRETTSGGGRIAVESDRNLTVDRPEAGPVSPFRAMLSPAPADWPRPIDRQALWLQYDDDPASLPLRVTIHARTVTQETVLLVKVGRRDIELWQETECAARFGSFHSLDVAVPPALKGRWALEEGDVEEREDLGAGSSGERVERLKFAGEVTEKVFLKFHARLPLDPPLAPDPPADVPIPWLSFPGATTGPMRVRVAAEPGVLVDAQGRGWDRESGAVPGEPGETGPPVQFTLVSAEGGSAPLRLRATAQSLAALPALVVSRHLIRSVQGPARVLRTTASYRVEIHEGSLPIALPPGAEWVRARVGGETIDQIETLAGGAGYRLRFPTRWVGSPVLVELEYTVPARLGSPPWHPPRLLDGGLIQETLWEARLPWTQAVVGAPAGWTDENEWHWDRYVWKRRPWKDGAGLSTWVGGPSGRVAGADEENGRDDHAYLFGKPGAPPPLGLWVASRAGLVAVCSGTVLGVGSLLLLVWRPPARLLTLALAALALAVAVALQASVALLAVQSAALGVVLTLLAAAMYWGVEHRRPALGTFGDTSGLASAPTPGSSVNRAPGVGSDDSTAIRVRPVSTADYIIATPPPPGENTGGRSASTVARAGES